jgi:hypothetical protein
MNMKNTPHSPWHDETRTDKVRPASERSPAIPASLQSPLNLPGASFREQIRLRSETPLSISLPPHRWGLNE